MVGLQSVSNLKKLRSFVNASLAIFCALIVSPQKTLMSFVSASLMFLNNSILFAVISLVSIILF